MGTLILDFPFGLYPTRLRVCKATHFNKLQFSGAYRAPKFLSFFPSPGSGCFPCHRRGRSRFFSDVKRRLHDDLAAGKPSSGW